MNKAFVLLFSLFLLLPYGALAVSEPIAFARYPAIHKDTLVFSYAGDLWSVGIEGGRANRLTVHEAYDYRPVFSPSGEEIAFSSTRYGDSDVFVIPSEGGEAERLTYFSNFDRVTDWSDERIVFYSYRDAGVPELPSVYSVNRSGGTPQKLIDADGFEGKLSPDGRILAFVRGDAVSSEWWTKGYSGSANRDIWLYFIEEDRYERITDSRANECYPMWLDDSTLCYVSDDGGTPNLWKISRDGKERLTSFEGDGVRFPYLSEGRIAYENGKDIRILDLKSGEDRAVKIYATTDVKSNRSGKVTFNGGVSELALSPNGRELAFVVLGEVFVMDLSSGEKQRITNTSALDYQVSWAPDGKTLLFSSNRNGNFDIFSVTAKEPLSTALKRETRQLTDSEENEYSPSFSPDGKRIAYGKGKGDLWIMDSSGKGQRKLSDGRSLFYSLDYSWSPDSDCIALTKLDGRGNGDIFVVSVDGKETDVTKDPHNSYSPVWSKNGIYFVSTRADITYSRLASSDIWLATSESDDWEHADLERLTFFEGNESTIAVSESTIAFAGEFGGRRELWIMGAYGEGAQSLTSAVSPADIVINTGGTSIYFTDPTGWIYSVSLLRGTASLLPADAEIWIDTEAMREEVFSEAWSLVNDFFYDRNFGGKDWRTIGEKYSFATSLEGEDFYDAMRLMLGELGVSHLSISQPASGRRKSGMLGATLEQESGGMRVKSVMKGSPAEKAGIKEGELITAIDGRRIGKNTSIDELLDDKAGERVLVELGKREVELVPLSYPEAMELAYDLWEEENRRVVDEISNGKIGYVCIRSMQTNDLSKFQRELYSIGEGKDALIIDVRNNPGGWVADYILSMLVPQSYGYTTGREGNTVQQFEPPFYVWDRDIVVLCNQYSYSDAEIFCHAIKTFGRGKIVGVQTAGAVLGAYSVRLIDGSLLSLPVEAVYTSKGLKMEGNGCVPDIRIENEPGGKDRQLEAAVRVLASV